MDQALSPHLIFLQVQGSTLQCSAGYIITSLITESAASYTSLVRDSIMYEPAHGSATWSERNNHYEPTKVQNPPRHEFMPYHRTLCTNVTGLASSAQAVIMSMHAFRRKWPTVRMAFNGGVLDLCNRAVSEESPQIF